MRLSVWLLPAAAVLSAIVVGNERESRAQTSSLSLTWQAPPECPDEAVVRGEVDRLLAEGPRPTARIEAHAVVSRSEGGRWRVHIATIRDGVAGERSIEAASCRPLAEATALIVVLAIDPVRARGAQSPGGPGGTPPWGIAPGPATGAAPAPVSTVAPTSTASTATTPGPVSARPAVPDATLPKRPTETAASPQPARVPVHFGVFGAVGADVGTLPGPSVGAALAAALWLGPVRLEADGEHWFSRTRSGGNGLTLYGGTISLSDAGLAGCFAVARGRLEVAPCAGIELGDLHGVGAPTIESPTTSDGWWVSVVTALQAALRLAGPLWAGLRIEAIVPLLRDQFVAKINDQTTLIFQSRSPVAGRALLGPELRF